MRLAHVILVHAYPELLCSLIGKIKHPDADIYIQVDKKSDINDFKEALKFDNVYFIKNRNTVYWGSYSMVKATLSAFEEILEKNLAYTHFNLLSAQDYPLACNDVIHEFLFANSGKSFFHSLSVNEEWHEAIPRFTRYHLGDFKFPGRYKLQALINGLKLKRKIPGNLEPYGRSQWFSITPADAAFVIKYLAEHSSLRRFFRMTWAPDEFVFQTVLYNSDRREYMVNDNLRFVYFPEGSVHPKTLDMEDFPAILASGKFYARKVDGQKSRELLPKLDEMIAQSKAEYNKRYPNK